MFVHVCMYVCVYIHSVCMYVYIIKFYSIVSFQKIFVLQIHFDLLINYIIW